MRCWRRPKSCPERIRFSPLRGEKVRMRGWGDICGQSPRPSPCPLPASGARVLAAVVRVERLAVQESWNMSLVIEGGTIVAADRTYKADVLIEGETIKAIGEGLKGDSTLDAKDCFVLPGGIDPAHPSRHALHGHEYRRQLRERHQGGFVRRHDDGGRLLHPQSEPAADGGARRLGQALQGRRRRLFLPHVHHLLGRFRGRGHGQGGRERA